MHVCMYGYMYVTSTYVRMYVCVCTYVFMYECMYIYMYVCIYVCMYVHVYYNLTSSFPSVE